MPVTVGCDGHRFRVGTATVVLLGDVVGLDCFINIYVNNHRLTLLSALARKFLVYSGQWLMQRLLTGQIDIHE